MSPDYKFLIKLCNDFSPDGKILDFGCGSGIVVKLGKKQGLNIVGTDIFHQGNDSRSKVTEEGLLNNIVFEIIDGCLPFEDDYFDLIISNMVFEHVEDPLHSLNEIFRVLKPSGKVILKFPVIEIIREDHCGVPFAHRLPKSNILLFYYLFIMRVLRFGHNKKNMSYNNWAKFYFNYLNKFTFYKKQSFYDNYFIKKNLNYKFLNNIYLSYRLSHLGITFVKKFENHPFFRYFTKLIITRFGSLVYLIEYK